MEHERKQKKILIENFMEQHKKRKSIKNMSEIISYLKLHNLYFKTDQADGIPRITMVFKNCDRCPNYITEGCIWFYEEFMEVRVYYSKLGAEICQKSEYLSELYRLLNYINARLWVRVSDGLEDALYQSQYLISPRFYVTEDEMQDITATMLIPYTHFELDMLEMNDFITAALPDLLDGLSMSVFLLLEGKITVEEAIDMVRLEFLGERGGM
ncbi:hypothetical protein LRN_1005 [Ligilactobacillus ruminis DPC 6832]|uniref:Uncharacterized protein n=1 Tax=Ligilactobacillus ruminis DPC 6832 TaxID=1402208 RepID=A0A837DWW1_9LACO|nr:hypothetical protein [Ligilactobacillus ruminis]KIC04755.1 hypothetical protein LRN_1005 [Ligilactobacillus ruminis DPC 6832]